MEHRLSIALIFRLMGVHLQSYCRGARLLLFSAVMMLSPGALSVLHAERAAYEGPGHATDSTVASVRNPAWAILIDGKHNLHRITPALYRSAQIDLPMVGQLKELGVTTVVNLRESDADTKILQKSGIRTVHVPMHTWHIEDEEVIEALRA